MIATNKTHNNHAGRGRAIVDTVLLSFMINILSLAVPIVLLQVYDRVLPNNGTDTAVLLFTGAFIAVLIEGALRYARTKVLSKYSELFEYHATIEIFQKLFRSDLAATLGIGSGAMKQHLAQISSLRDSYSGQVVLAFYDLPFSLIFLAAIWYIGGNLVLVPLTLVLISSFVVYQAGKILKDRASEVSTIEDDRMNFVTQAFNKVLAIKSLGVEKHILARFRSKTMDLVRSRTSLNRVNSAITDVIAMIGGFTVVLTICFGAMKVMDNQLSIGGLAAVTILAGRSLGPIASIMMSWTQMQRLFVAKGRYSELLNLPEDKVFDLNSDTKFKDGAIEFKSVEIASADNKQCFSFKVKSGAKYMIESFSGGELQTIIGLLIGTKIPDSGEVLVGGNLLGSYNRSQYRRNFALVSEGQNVFRGSILDNLTLFRPVLEPEAFELSKKLGLSDFIYSLPNGFKTQVGDMLGGPLGRGVIQRIAIIRALLNRPKILFLNEADKGIDVASKVKLTEFLRSLEGVTVLLIPSDASMKLTFPETLNVSTLCKLSPVNSKE